MIKSVVLLLSGNAFASLLLLIRNLVVARLISPEDYGIAATFAISMALFEIIGNAGLQQLIVQDKDGENPRLQSGLQGFQVLRGIISSLALFLTAAPLANFLEIPDVAWAYQVLAIQPLMLALYHFDMHRLRRQMRFMPSILVDVMPALLSLLILFPLVKVVPDYRLMLYALIAQAAIGMVTSHIVAERKFRLSLDRDIVKRSIRFGWPLFINGALLFLMLHGEKLVVGRELGMTSLAIFAMGFTLTLTPTLVLARSMEAFFLPQLSAVQDDMDRFRPIAYATIELSILNGLLLLIAMVLIGQPLVTLLLGEKFDALVPLIVWFAVLHAVRVFKTGCAIVALSRAKTENAMIANLFRVLSLPLSYYAAITTGDLKLVVWIATLGELLGFAAALLLVKYRVGLPLGGLKWSLLATFTFIGLACAFATWGGLMLQAVCIAAFVMVLGCTRSTWRYLRARQLIQFDV